MLCIYVLDWIGLDWIGLDYVCAVLCCVFMYEYEYMETGDGCLLLSFVVFCCLLLSFEFLLY